MTLDRAIDAFMAGFAYTKSYAHPYVVTRVGDLRIMRDGPGRKLDPRLEEIIVHGTPPEEVVRQVRAYGVDRHAICTVESTGADYEALKKEYRQRGYRLISRQPFFVKDLSLQKPFSGKRVRRVASGADADLIFKTTRRRLSFREHLSEDDSAIRMYAAFDEQTVLGTVMSVTSIQGARWVANLVVEPQHRRKGIGSELMLAMLDDDRRLGYEHSVLLASTAGSKLYPLLGYEQIGLLQIFMPIRPRR